MIKYLSKVACCLSVSFLVFSGISYAQQAAPKTIISGTLKVAVYNDFAPFAEKGAGLDVDIAAALAKKMALQLSVLPFNAGDDVGDDLRNMVWKGHYLGYGPADVMMHVPVDASLANRNDKVTIFAPYLRESVRVVRDVQKLPNYSNVDSLAGQKIAVDGTSLGAMLILGYKNGQFREDVKLFGSATEALGKLKNGEVSAVIANQAEIDAVLQQDPKFALNELRLPLLPQNGWVVGMAVKNDNPALVEALTNALKAITDSGELAQIFANYHVQWVKP